MTRADRLMAVIEQLAPTAALYHASSGAWPARPGASVDAPTETAAPYVIETLPSGGRRIRVIGEDGDVVSGMGATMDEALSALEAKIR